MINCSRHFSAFPPLTNHAILYDVLNVKLQLCVNRFVWLHGESTSVFFSFSFMLNSNNTFQTLCFNWYLSNEKSTLQIIQGLNLLYLT